MHDDIKLTVSTNVPGTPLDTRTIRVQGANINIIDLSKRQDIDSVSLNLIVKAGVAYDDKRPVTLSTEEANFKIDDTKNIKDRMSQVPFIGKFFKNKA
jgi:hypothetical protein